MKYQRIPTRFRGIFSYVTTKGETRFLVRFRGPKGRSSDKLGFTRLTDARSFQQDVTGEVRKGSYVALSSP